MPSAHLAGVLLFCDTMDSSVGLSAFRQLQQDIGPDLGNAVLFRSWWVMALGQGPEAGSKARGGGLAQSGTLAFEGVRVVGVFKVHSF